MPHSKPSWAIHPGSPPPPALSVALCVNIPGSPPLRLHEPQASVGPGTQLRKQPTRDPGPNRGRSRSPDSVRRTEWRDAPSTRTRVSPNWAPRTPSANAPMTIAAGPKPVPDMVIISPGATGPGRLLAAFRIPVAAYHRSRYRKRQLERRQLGSIGVEDHDLKRLCSRSNGSGDGHPDGRGIDKGGRYPGPVYLHG